MSWIVYTSDFANYQARQGRVTQLAKLLLQAQYGTNYYVGGAPMYYPQTPYPQVRVALPVVLPVVNRGFCCYAAATSLWCLAQLVLRAVALPDCVLSCLIAVQHESLQFSG